MFAAGSSALVVDVLVHPWVVEHADRDKTFRKGLVDLVTASVFPELNWVSAEDPETGRRAEVVEIRALYKGGMPVPGFEKSNKHLVTMRFLVHDKDRPAHKTHTDCSATALPLGEATERAKAATGEAIKLAAAAAGGDEALKAIESLESAKSATAAASATAERMRSPSTFLAEARADTTGTPASSSGLLGAKAATSQKPGIYVVSESTAHDDDEEVAGAVFAGTAPGTASAGASIGPASAPPGQALSVAVVRPAAGSGRVELLLSGVVSGEQRLRVEVQPPARLRIALPGRTKRVKVTVPLATLVEAAPAASAVASGQPALVSAGARVTRLADGRVRLLVAVARA